MKQKAEKKAAAVGEDRLGSCLVSWTFGDFSESESNLETRNIYAEGAKVRVYIFIEVTSLVSH